MMALLPQMSKPEPYTQVPLPPFHLLPDKPGSIRIALTPPYDIDYFAGHFPGLPVLPGVTLLTWTFQLAADLGLHCDPNALKNLKFTHVIKPDTPLTLELRPDGEKGRVRFAWHSGSQSCASGIMFWTLSDD